MDVKRRYALKHIDSGKYISWSPDNFPLTHKLSQARRFLNTEEMSIFLEHSPYKPDKPEEYEVITIKITYEEETEDEQCQSPALSKDAQRIQSG